MEKGQPRVEVVGARRRIAAKSCNIWGSHTLVDLGMVERVDMKSALILMFLLRLNRRGGHIHTEAFGR